MDIQYAVDLINQMLYDDRERDDNFNLIDKAVQVVYENPPELQALSWIGRRKFPTTAFADASKAAIRTFATKMPEITIFPTLDDEAQYLQMERIESAIEWEFERVNRVGAKPVHWQVIESAVNYSAVALQTDYLPYSMKKRKGEQRVKNALRQAKFNWTVHHPGSVHVLRSRLGNEVVVKAVQMNLEELIAEFGRDNPGIAQLVSEYDPKDRASRLATWMSYFDMYTLDERVQFASPSTGVNARPVAGGSNYVFLNEKHGMPFIPWVVVDNQDPIMLPAIKAGLFDNANILNTIAFSKAVDMAAHPELWIRTVTGDLHGVHIDNTNPSQPLVTDKGAEVIQLRPPAIDPQLMTMQQEAKADIFRSAVAQVLSDISNIGQTATFSTVNAMLEAAITQLALAENAASRAETLAVYQMFEWLEFSDIPLIAYRSREKSEGKQVGQELVIQANYTGDNPNINTFDLEQLYLEVKLKSTSITDKQAELTSQVTMVERLNKSRRAALEDLGQRNYEADAMQRGVEDLTLAHLAAEAKRIQNEADLEAQAKMAQLQQAAAAGNQQGQPGGAQPNADTTGNQVRGTPAEAMAGMMDNRGGGQAAPMAGMNEAMTGQTRGGQGMA